jgi:succinate dehydrogenase/fumarate reductase flavoprotein subunit
MEQIEIHPTHAAGEVTGSRHGANALGVDSISGPITSAASLAGKRRYSPKEKGA